MLFTSYQFIGFLFFAVVLFYLVPKKFQTAILLFASYFFYFAASGSCLIYVVITTVVTFWTAKKIEKSKNRKTAKRWLLFCLGVQLGLLCVFKYTNFTIHNMNTVLALFGAEETIRFVDILLPLGISYYTFQSVGYSMDVYWKKSRAETSLLRLALFVSFFPQMIQGPISRYRDVSKTLYSEKKFEVSTVCAGLQRILWGFFKKLVIADRILVAVNTIIQNTELYQGAYVFLGAVFYAVELYADFTGGIDITIGTAQLFGIQLVENFKQPFLSKSVKEYWTRWHITMGTWFRDYVFYPVSISRPIRGLTHVSRTFFGKSVSRKLPVYLASFIVWFLTGLWHGASWNFIAWGIGNFLIITISQECSPLYRLFHKKFPMVKERLWFRVFQILRTILLMSCLRMFDCYRSVKQTFFLFGTIFTKWDSRIFVDGSLLKLGLTMTDYIILAAGMILMLSVSLVQQKGSVRLQLRQWPPYVRYFIWYGLFLAVLLFGFYGIGYDAAQFIYHQF